MGSDWNFKDGRERRTFKRLWGSLRKYKIGALDIEDDSQGNLILIVFYDGKEFYEFYDAKLFKIFLKRRKYRDWVIVGNNIGYDLVGMWGLEAEDMTFIFNKTMFITARLQVQGGRWPRYVRFMDVWNHAKASVAQMGEMLGCEKLDMDDAMGEYHRTGDMTKLIEYCRRDVMIVFRFAEHLQEFYNGLGCSMKLTVASTSMDLFRRKYLKIKWRELHPEVLDIFRRGYYGGRVECFYIGEKEGEFFLSDFNSMYPAVMRKTPLPDVDMMRVAFDDISVIEDYDGMSCITVETSDLYIPILPHRSTGGKLIFPVGKFTGWYTHNEIRYAMERGYKVHDVHVSIYTKYSHIVYEGFVNDLYDLRKSAKEKWRDKMLKTLLNSSYGKWAQAGGVTHVMTLSKAIDEYLSYQNRYPNAELYVPDETKDIGVYYIEDHVPLHTNVIWAAYITAAARIELVRAMDDETLYCDTDSILSTARCVDSDELGGLKLEGVFKHIRIILPKLYEFEGVDGKYKRAAKGIPTRHRRPSDPLSPIEIEQGIVRADKDGRMSPSEEIFKSTALRVSFTKPNRYFESLKRGLKINAWEERTKQIRSTYDKRHVRSDGSTEPFEVWVA